MTEITAHHGLFRNTKLHVDDTGGQGPPVVLIHGWPLSGASWKYQIPALAEAGRRVVTYDRRGFGRSDKPLLKYSYDTLAEDLHVLLTELDLRGVTLVGFSMGGGEVARYVATYGPERLSSIVFASSVTPYMMQSDENPEGPLTKKQAADMGASLTKNQDAFYDGFVTEFFSAGGEVKVTDAQWREARDMCDEADKKAALTCMTLFGTTDFRDDLAKITVPTLVLHGDSDATVPFAGSGARTHAAVPGSKLHLVTGGPHGVNVSHTGEWNRALLNFLGS
ncbi:alpha/beta fold hydrolase [Amycolatopsis sp. NPDC004378]